jgi:hypothetical protein
MEFPKVKSSEIITTVPAKFVDKLRTIIGGGYFLLIGRDTSRQDFHLKDPKNLNRE